MQRMPHFLKQTARCWFKKQVKRVKTHGPWKERYHSWYLGVAIPNKVFSYSLMFSITVINDSVYGAVSFVAMLIKAI